MIKSIKGKRVTGMARKLDLDSVKRAKANASRPGFNEKFKHPRRFRNKTNKAAI